MFVQTPTIISILLMTLVDARTYVIVDDNLRDCEKADNRLVDWTEYHLIAVNDTLTIVNGSITFLKDIESPWFGHFHAEHYERGQWLPQGYVQNIADLCKEIHNPIQPWYKKMKNYGGCPIKQGTVWKFDMVPIEIAEKTMKFIPPHYAGRWRVIFDTKCNENDAEIRECKVGFGDVYVE